MILNSLPQNDLTTGKKFCFFGSKLMNLFNRFFFISVKQANEPNQTSEPRPTP